MGSLGPEYWWAIGIGTVALVAVALAFLVTLVVGQSKLRAQLQVTRASEVKYRNLFDNSLVGMLRISVPEFLVIDCNRTFTRLLGKTSAEEVRGSFYSISPDGVNNLKSILFRDGALDNAEIQLRHDDGRSLWVSLTCRLHHTEGYAEGVVLDITERKHAEERLVDSHQQLRNLSARLESIREEERVRIARQVHDELGQILTGVKIHLTVMTNNVVARDPKRKAVMLNKLESLIRIIDDAINLVKNISYDLRPLALDDLGLKEAIEWETSQFGERMGIECKVQSNGDMTLGREQATAVFRIFQEALTNIARHASADTVHVRMSSRNGSFVLEVVDNGRGITEDQVRNPKALGILGMKERAMFLGGELKVLQNNGKGTFVGLIVPTNRSEHHGNENLHRR